MIEGSMGIHFFTWLGDLDQEKNNKAVLDWVVKEELNSHRWDLLNAKIHNNNIEQMALHFHLVSKYVGLLYEFIQTLANEGRNLEFMLQPDDMYHQWFCFWVLVRNIILIKPII